MCHFLPSAFLSLLTPNPSTNSHSVVFFGDSQAAHMEMIVDLSSGA